MQNMFVSFVTMKFTLNKVTNTRAFLLNISKLIDLSVYKSLRGIHFVMRICPVKTSLLILCLSRPN